MGDALNIVTMPYGIADVRSGLVYATDPDGRVHVVRASNGAVEAESKVAARPLAARDDALIAWSARSPREPHVMALQPDGSQLVVMWQHHLELPDWVLALFTDPELDEQFRIAASISDADMVDVAWEAHARYRGGAPPSIEVEAAARRDALGGVRLRLADGEAIGSPDAPAVPEMRIASADSPAAVGSRDRVMSYRHDGRRRTEPWRVGGAAHQLVVRADQPGFSLVHDTESGPVDVRLAEDAQADAALSLDGHLVLAQDPGAGNRAWNVFDARTAERTGQLNLSGELVSVLPIDDVLVTVTREAAGGVRRVSLSGHRSASGERLWSHVVDELAESGAPPLPQ